MISLARRRQERLLTEDGVVLDGSGQEVPVDSLHGRYMAKISMALGILMILGGVLSIVLGIVALVKSFTMAYIGTGLWVGLLFHISTGALGIVAGRIKHMNIQDASRAVNGFLVMCIVNICSGCAAQLLLGVIAAAVDRPLYFYSFYEDDEELGDGLMYAFDVTFIIVSLVEGLFCVIGIVIASIATCCRSSTGYVTQTCVSTCTTTTPAVTVLNIGPQQQQPAGYYPQQPPVYQPQMQAQPGMCQPPQAQPPMYQPVQQPPVQQPPVQQLPVQQPSVHQPPQMMVLNNKM
ncbi:unnamed protein product [Owenia fusiformis]|uniref:Uncharacterized protein n=1 Tax=Owenia fusiformis TaxID=6347 RepID=A0A8S4NDP6_OWEFU|nr:unnamed protein product [Owenia fusiformis]